VKATASRKTTLGFVAELAFDLLATPQRRKPNKRRRNRSRRQGALQGKSCRDISPMYVVVLVVFVVVVVAVVVVVVDDVVVFVPTAVATE